MSNNDIATAPTTTLSPEDHARLDVTLGEVADMRAAVRDMHETVTAMIDERDYIRDARVFPERDAVDRRYLIELVAAGNFDEVDLTDPAMVGAVLQALCIEGSSATG